MKAVDDAAKKHAVKKQPILSSTLKKSFLGTSDTSNKRMLAVVLVRGLMGVRQDAKDTLFMLHLRRKHNCVIVQDNPTNRGMLNKVKNYVAYGIIDAETLGLLREKRPISSKAKSRSRYAHTLHPPRGGFEREGIKKSYTKGGVLGDRKDKINALIRKML